MTWRKSNLDWESSWGSNSDVLLYSVEFEERKSWNPLEGTTLKRNFITKLEEHKLVNNKLQKQSEFEFPFWTLSNNLFYNSEKKLIFLLRGKEKTGYGTEERIVSIYKILDKNLENLWSSKEGEYLWKILPSPDASKILFLTTSGAASSLDAKLHVWDGRLRSLKISEWLDASYEHAVAWKEDSKLIYLALPEGVFQINTSEANLSLQKANEFPKCFIPSTSFGFRISSDGKELKVDPSKRANSTTVIHEKFTPFEKIPK
ncbi:MAG: hypothetical protein QXO70_04765, partial [Candidatus Pacearchaeota archaeon]